MNVSLTKSCMYLGLAFALNVAWISPAAAWPEEGRAAIMPALARISPGESLQFHAIQLPRRLQVSRPATRVEWSVNGVSGGNNALGRIDANGLYRAPDAAPSPSAVHIGAHVPDARNSMLFATALLAGNSAYRSDSRWPVEEIEKAGLKKPGRITTDSKGRFLVMDIQTGRLGQFKKDGTYLDSFGRGPEGNSIGGVCMVAVAPSGQVYTGDLATGPPRLNAFKPKGDWLLGFGQKGSRPGMVLQPTGMAFHPDGWILVSDMDAMRLSIFDADHVFQRYLRERSPEGNRMNAPSDVAIDGAGDVFVSSTYGPCEKLSAVTGERLLAFSYPMPPDGAMYIDDVCLDRWGDVFLAVRSAADVFNSGPNHGGVASIIKYTNSGDYLTEITLSANAPTRVSVEVDADGRLYAAYSTEETAGVEVFVQE
jgi:hypothetical protein